MTINYINRLPDELLLLMIPENSALVAVSKRFNALCLDLFRKSLISELNLQGHGNKGLKKAKSQKSCISYLAKKYPTWPKGFSFDRQNRIHILFVKACNLELKKEKLFSNDDNFSFFEDIDLFIENSCYEEALLAAQKWDRPNLYQTAARVSYVLCETDITLAVSLLKKYCSDSEIKAALKNLINFSGQKDTQKRESAAYLCFRIMRSDEAAQLLMQNWTAPVIEKSISKFINLKVL